MNAVADATERPWTIRRVLGWAADDFQRRGDRQRAARRRAAARACARHRSHPPHRRRRPPALGRAELARYRELIKRRRAGEPVAYLLGGASSTASSSASTSACSIPRPDTETLVEVALERTRARSMSAARSTCAPARAASRSRSPASGRPGASPRIDLSTATRSQSRGERAPPRRSLQRALLAGDLFAPLAPDERFDLITANPPYIPSAEIDALAARRPRFRAAARARRRRRRPRGGSPHRGGGAAAPHGRRRARARGRGGAEAERRGAVRERRFRRHRATARLRRTRARGERTLGLSFTVFVLREAFGANLRLRHVLPGARSSRCRTFWAERGCLIVQPYNSEVGAGTYNPATFLRALGPEPWNVAFVEPSRRPTDGRYGENPNRAAAVPPVPGDPQAERRSTSRISTSSRCARSAPIRSSTTCASSRTTGSRRRSAPGASAGRCGSTGSRSAQFTYFQQVGGIDCKPGLRRAHLRPRAHRDVPAGRATASTTWSTTRDVQLRRDLQARRVGVVDVQLRGGRRGGALRRVRSLRGGGQAPARAVGEGRRD